MLAFASMTVKPSPVLAALFAPVFYPPQHATPRAKTPMAPVGESSLTGGDPPASRRFFCVRHVRDGQGIQCLVWKTALVYGR